MGTLKVFDGQEYKPVGVTINQTINQYSGIEMVKLWENPNPTSEFTELTVAINMSAYDGFEVVYLNYVRDNYAKSYSSTGYLPKGLARYSLTAPAVIYEDKKMFFGRRDFTVSNSGFAFDGGIYSFLTSGAYGSVTSVCIPVEIYGIKEASVQTGGGSAGVSFDKMYPVGAVYISTVATNPTDLFGFGTWQQIEDTFLLAAGKNYAAGSTGGEAEHTLTEEEMPKHTHRIAIAPSYVTATASSGALALGSAGYIPETESTGGSQPHNNMPPYLAVYVWQRTA